MVKIKKVGPIIFCICINQNIVKFKGVKMPEAYALKVRNIGGCVKFVDVNTG